MATQPASSTAQLIEDLCDNFAVWAPALQSPPTPGKALAGGYNHYLQVLDGPTQRWVVRIAQNDRRSIDERTLEANVQSTAADAGIAPSICYSDPRRGITIMDYHEPDNGASESITEIAELYRQIHALPLLGKALHSPIAFRRGRTKAAGDSSLATLLKQGAATIDSAMAFLEHDASINPVMCHNDLLGANRLCSQGRLFALDWEYAAPGDPFFDLAVGASQLIDGDGDGDGQALLNAYLQRKPSGIEEQRFAAQRLLYAGIEACWYSAHEAHSPEAQSSVKRLANRLRGEALS